MLSKKCKPNRPDGGAAIKDQTYNFGEAMRLTS